MCKDQKSAGKPHSGPTFEIYKNTIRKRQRVEREYYSNELHEALI